MIKLIHVCSLTILSLAAYAAPIIDTLDSGPSVSLTTPSLVPQVVTGTGASVLGQTANRTFSILSLNFTNTHPFSMTASFVGSELQMSIGPGQGFDLNLRSSVPNSYIIQPSDAFLALDLARVDLFGGFSAGLEVIDLFFGPSLAPLNSPSIVDTGAGTYYYFAVDPSLIGTELTGWNLTAIVGRGSPNGSSFALREAYFTDAIPAAIPEPALFLPLAATLASAFLFRRRRR